MTYNVFSGTLNPAQSNHALKSLTILLLRHYDRCHLVLYILTVTARSELRKVVFAAVSRSVFCLCMKYLANR